MDKLRASFEAPWTGTGAKPYIQSGNVVFKTAKTYPLSRSPGKLKIVFLEISAFPLPSFRELLTRSKHDRQPIAFLKPAWHRSPTRLHVAFSV